MAIAGSMMFVSFPLRLTVFLVSFLLETSSFTRMERTRAMDEFVNLCVWLDDV